MKNQEPKIESPSIAALRGKLKQIDKNFDLEDSRHEKRMAELSTQKDSVKADIKKLLESQLEELL